MLSADIHEDGSIEIIAECTSARRLKLRPVMYQRGAERASLRRRASKASAAGGALVRAADQIHHLKSKQLKDALDFVRKMERALIARLRLEHAMRGVEIEHLALGTGGQS